jgi:serine/threonine protein kinase
MNNLNNFIVTKEKMFKIDDNEYTLQDSLYLDNKTTKVLLASDKSGKKVVIKKLRSSYNNAIFTVRSFRNELKMHSLFSHRNIISLYCNKLENKAFSFKKGKWENSYLIAMEYGAKGDLFTLVKDSGGIPLDKAVYYFRQMITGLVDIYRKGVCHRDIKLENLIINENDELKIADFEFSAFYRDSGGDLVVFRDSRIGSRGYNAPEIYTRYFYGDKLDVFSAGMVLVAMLEGRLLFQDTNITDSVFRAFMENKENFLKTHLKSDISEELFKLILAMLEPDYNKRISFEDILKSDVFKECEQPVIL